MPTAASRHPSDVALAEYALGKLEANAAETIQDHLTVCTDCRTVVEKTPSDSLVALLQKAHRTGTLAAPTPPRGSTAVQFPGRVPVLDIAGLPQELRDHPRYRIVRLLGRGGMGVVYQAEHRVMERTVAVKVINAAMLGDADAVERFQREVKAAAKLEHPNIVRAYDAEQAGELQLLAMEYVEGKSLADVIEVKGPLPVGYACQCIRQAALGLQQAFEHGMVHRDIKPHNLILSSKGVVKILDFGLAKLVSERQTHGGLTSKDVVMGTPEYMAPEQARDCRSADVRADIYSLGCTLYCLLTGRPPFTGGTALELVMKQVQDEPRPVHELRPDVPMELSALVGRMLAKDPAQRPQTPKEVAESLVAFTKAHGASLRERKPPESVFAGLQVGPKAQTSPAGPSKQKWIAIGAALAAIAAIALSIFLIKMPDGYVELDVPDNTEVRVNGEVVTVKQPDSGPIQVKVNKDKKTVTVVKDGVVVESRDLTLSDKGKTVRVGWRENLAVAKRETPGESRNDESLTKRDTAGAIRPKLNVELLQNPGCEEPLREGKFPGWRTVRGNWWPRHTTVSPRIGDSYFHAADSAQSELSQDVDVSGFAANIDAGKQEFHFSGYLQVARQNIPDTARIVLEYRNTPAGAILAQFDTGGERHMNSWLEVNDHRVAPPQTRLIRVRLISSRSHATTNDACYDDLSLKAVGAPTSSP
jgi:serine/threonine protein kinase